MSSSFSIFITSIFSIFSLSSSESDDSNYFIGPLFIFENPSWLAYASPIAQSNAIKQNISQDEAIENLRREQMMIFNESPHQPIYWQHRY